MPKQAAPDWLIRMQADHSEFSAPTNLQFILKELKRLYEENDQLNKQLVDIERLTWREGNTRSAMSITIIDIRKISRPTNEKT